jgi:hypothetical protein
MQHPFDGITDSSENSPTRRTALGQLAAATAGLLGLQTSAAGEETKTTAALNEEGGNEFTKALGEQGFPTQARSEGGYGPPTYRKGESGEQFVFPPSPPPLPELVDLSRKQLDDAWAALGSTDGNAFHTLLAGRQTSAFLVERLKSELAPPDAAQLGRLIDELGNERFSVRQAATAALEKIGLPADPALRKALTKQPSLEMMRRIEAILGRIDDMCRTQGIGQKLTQALDLLLLVGTAEGLGLVAALAERPGGWLAEQAQSRVEQVRQACWLQRMAARPTLRDISPPRPR